MIRYSFRVIDHALRPLDRTNNTDILLMMKAGQSEDEATESKNNKLLTRPTKLVPPGQLIILTGKTNRLRTPNHACKLKDVANSHALQGTVVELTT